jgi:hypothetical protein
MAKLDLIPVIDERLGNSTYLLDLGAGRTFVIDPSVTCAKYVRRLNGSA